MVKKFRIASGSIRIKDVTKYIHEIDAKMTKE